jgi:hypothetical protein
MKFIRYTLGIAVICASLAACSSEKETVVREQPIVQERVVHDRTPVIVQSAPSAGMSSSSVEANCAHGYDNSTHSCY